MRVLLLVSAMVLVCSSCDYAQCWYPYDNTLELSPGIEEVLWKRQDKALDGVLTISISYYEYVDGLKLNFLGSYKDFEVEVKVKLGMIQIQMDGINILSVSLGGVKSKLYLQLRQNSMTLYSDDVYKTAKKSLDLSSITRITVSDNSLSYELRLSLSVCLERSLCTETSNMVVAVGNTMNLDCTAFGPPPLHLQWTLNRNSFTSPIKNSSNTEIHSTRTISDFSGQDAGTYTCIISNYPGTTILLKKVFHVYDKPKMIIGPALSSTNTPSYFSNRATLSWTLARWSSFDDVDFNVESGPALLDDKSTKYSPSQYKTSGWPLSQGWKTFTFAMSKGTTSHFVMRCSNITIIDKTITTPFDTFLFPFIAALVSALALLVALLLVLLKYSPWFNKQDQPKDEADEVIEGYDLPPILPPRGLLGILAI